MRKRGQRSLCVHFALVRTSLSRLPRKEAESNGEEGAVGDTSGKCFSHALRLGGASRGSDHEPVDCQNQESKTMCRTNRRRMSPTATASTMISNRSTIAALAYVLSAPANRQPSRSADDVPYAYTEDGTSGALPAVGGERRVLSATRTWARTGDISVRLAIGPATQSVEDQREDKTCEDIGEDNDGGRASFADSKHPVAEAFAQALRRGDDLRSPERWVWRTSEEARGPAASDRRTPVRIDKLVGQVVVSATSR